jgi:hypothetical protein
MPTSSPHTTLPAPRLPEVENLRAALAGYQSALQSTPSISGALATEILAVLTSAQVITDALRVERAILLVLDQQLQSNALLSRELLLALMGHVLRGVMRSQEAHQQHGRIAGLRRWLASSIDDRARHDLCVLLQQADTTLARVAQAALQQRAQARKRGLSPDGILAAAARWHLAQQQREADRWWSGEQQFMRLLTPEERAIEATEAIIEHAGADLLAALDGHPAVAAVLINDASLAIPYRFCGKRRTYVPDAIVRLATEPVATDNPLAPDPESLRAGALIDRLIAGDALSAADDQVELTATFRTAVFAVLEIRRSRDVRDQAQAEAAEHWCAAMSAAGNWGRWVYLLCPTVEELPARLDVLIAVQRPVAVQCVEEQRDEIV